MSNSFLPKRHMINGETWLEETPGVMIKVPQRDMVSEVIEALKPGEYTTHKFKKRLRDIGFLKESSYLDFPKGSDIQLTITYKKTRIDSIYRKTRKKNDLWVAPAFEEAHPDWKNLTVAEIFSMDYIPTKPQTGRLGALGGNYMVLDKYKYYISLSEIDTITIHPPDKE